MKLRATLLNMIDSRELQIGDRLSPELDLCRQLDVSRAALRKVLDELHSEGYIQRVQGSGTVILRKRTKYVLNLSIFGGAAETISGHSVLGIEHFRITEIDAGRTGYRIRGKPYASFCANSAVKLPDRTAAKVTRIFVPLIGGKCFVDPFKIGEGYNRLAPDR